MTTPELYVAKIADQEGWNPRLVGVTQGDVYNAPPETAIETWH